MSKRNEEIEPVEIRQVENGYVLMMGYNCNTVKTQLVFQSWAELAEYLNEHFTYRNDNISVDNYNSND